VYRLVEYAEVKKELLSVVGEDPRHTRFLICSSEHNFMVMSKEYLRVWNASALAAALY
jgi:hypothetical protein